MTVGQRIMDLLKDGLPHTEHELRECLSDDLAPLSALNYHICMLRKGLVYRGENISTCVHFGVKYYAHVRVVHTNQ